MKNTQFRISRRLIIIAIALFVVCCAGGLWFSRIQWIPAGYVGVIYNAQSGLRNDVLPPQAIFIGPFDQLYIYPTRLQAAIYSEDPEYGEARIADGIQITTSDSAITTFDVTVLYRVKKDDVLTVFAKFGAIPIEDIQTLHIRRAVREGASAIGNQYDVFQLLGPKRREASERLTIELQNRLASKGITVVKAMLNTAYPSADIASKITGRVNSYTQLEISKLESQIAEIQRLSAVVLGSANNEARTLTASETQAKSVEMLKLELEEKAIEKWKEAGGRLPPIVVRPGSTVIVNGNGSTVIPGAQR